MTDFVFPDVTFVDVNTHEEVTCGFDTLRNVAEPDAWGMVRFHPHAPVELMYPPAPQYVHELEGVAQDAVLGVLAKTVKPGLAAGLEAIVDKLSDGSNRLEYPPGQRGNPLPVSEVVRQEYARLFPQDDDETNIYRMQVYTWRLSDVIRVCKRLLLDPDAIFRTQTSPAPPSALNFAGDSSYGDDIRLREPNCEPLLSDGLFVGEGKYRVFRKAPGIHPRDRPATYHNNYSEVAGAPDPLHDFGIKHWRNDAGQAAQFRYACCWEAPGSPGCLITYPSKSTSQTIRNDQGCLERVAGLPVLYQWFGGFAPTTQTAKFRGAAFLDRDYADALHEKIVGALSESDTIARIAKGERLTERQACVVLQVAEWIHQYNAPLMGCALYLRDFPDNTSEVETYLDRVIVGRRKTSTTKSAAVPEPAAVVKPVVTAAKPAPTPTPSPHLMQSPWWDLVVVNPKEPIPNNDERLTRLRQYYFKHLRVLTPFAIGKLRIETEEYRQGRPAHLDASLAHFARADTHTQELVLGKLRPVYSQKLDDIDDQYLVDASAGDKMIDDFKEQLFRDVPLLEAVQANAQLLIDYNKSKRSVPDDIWQLLVDAYREDHPSQKIIDAERKNDWAAVRGLLYELPRFLTTLRITWNAYHSNRSATVEEVYDAFTDVMRFSFKREEDDLAVIWSPTQKWTQIPATDPKRFEVFLDTFLEYMQKESGRTEEDWARVMEQVTNMTKAAPPGPPKGFPQLKDMEVRIAKRDAGVIPVFADMVSTTKFKEKVAFDDLATYVGFAFNGKYARKITYVTAVWTAAEPFVQLRNLRLAAQEPFAFVKLAQGEQIAFVIMDCLATFLRTKNDHRQWCRNAVNVLGDVMLYSVLKEGDPTRKLRRLLNAGLYDVADEITPFEASRTYGLRDNVESFYQLANALFLRREKDWVPDEVDKLTIYVQTVAFDSRLPIKATVRETLANRDFYVSNPTYTSKRSWVVPSVEYFNRVVERVLEGIAEIQWTGNLDVDAFLETF